MLKAPFPYFGGKSKIAHLIWERLGDVRSYVEPFFGSGAVLLARPHEPGIETVNDLNGMVANFWRALQAEPAVVAKYADWPVNENDLSARHAWLVEQKDSLQARLEGDPEWYDAKIAGWWVWGMACWIGKGFCSGNGAWVRVNTDAGWELQNRDAGQGVQRQLVHLGDAGQGVQRQRVHLGNAGQGVQRRRVHLSPGGGSGVASHERNLYDWLQALSDRLRRVRVCCGDWSRVCGPTPTIHNGLTGVFLDPPYTSDKRDKIYTDDSYSVAGDVEAYCREWQAHPLMRIALCGYEGDYDLPGWDVVAWKAHGGYGGQRQNEDNVNRHEERIWFSPNCLKVEQWQQVEMFQEE